MSNWFTDKELSQLFFLLKNDTPHNRVLLQRWGEEARINHGLLENILEGSMAVELKNGVPSFSLTSDGITRVERILDEKEGD